jgi:netrin receptor unc-5
MTTTGLVGKSVEIRCLAPEGDPKPNVFWLKNGIAMDKTNKRVFVSHEGGLLVNDIRLSDNANYTCIAENLAGKRTSDSAILVVTENKGWSDWTNWTECSSLSHIDCGEGIHKRYRTCYTPSSTECDGSPVQVVPCIISCEKTNDKIVPVEWSDWSDWLIECDNRDNCLKMRKRTCLNANLPRMEIKNTCMGSDTETTNCSKSFCESHRQGLLFFKIDLLIY